MKEICNDLDLHNNLHHPCQQGQNSFYFFIMILHLATVNEILIFLPTKNKFEFLVVKKLSAGTAVKSNFLKIIHPITTNNANIYWKEILFVTLNSRSKIYCSTKFKKEHFFWINNQFPSIQNETKLWTCGCDTYREKQNLHLCFVTRIRFDQKLLWLWIYFYCDYCPQ